MKHDKVNEVKLQELPLFDFEKLAIATNHFHFNNKIGQGGFGSVYKVGINKLLSFFLLIKVEERCWKFLPSFFFFFFLGKIGRWTRNSSKETFKDLWTRA